MVLVLVVLVLDDDGLVVMGMPLMVPMLDDDCSAFAGAAYGSAVPTVANAASARMIFRIAISCGLYCPFIIRNRPKAFRREF